MREMVPCSSWYMQKYVFSTNYFPYSSKILQNGNYFCLFAHRFDIISYNFANWKLSHYKFRTTYLLIIIYSTGGALLFRFACPLVVDKMSCMSLYHSDHPQIKVILWALSLMACRSLAVVVPLLRATGGAPPRSSLLWRPMASEGCCLLLHDLPRVSHRSTSYPCRGGC